MIEFLVVLQMDIENHDIVGKYENKWHKLVIWMFLIKKNYMLPF